MVFKRKSRVVEAAGSAAATGGASTGEASVAVSSREIEAAMVAAGQKCFDAGIHDPAKVLAAKLEARAQIKKAKT